MKKKNNSKFLKNIEYIYNHTYFWNINDQLSKILGYSIINQNFLVFNNKITSSLYWTETHKSTRNYFAHKPSFNNKFDISHTIFIIIDFYILLRTLWSLSLTNWNALQILDNANGKNNKAPELWKFIREKIKDDHDLLNQWLSELLSLRAGMY